MSIELEHVHDHLVEKHFGGLYQYETQEKDDHKYSNYVQSLKSIDFWISWNVRHGIFLPNKSIPLIAGVIAGATRLNACAFKMLDRHYIAICRGSFDIIACTCNRLMCEPDVFTFIGNAEREESGRAKSAVFQDAMLLHAHDIIYPKDPARAAAAKFIGNVARDFLLLHELYHILSGHVDYYAGQLGHSLIDECEHDALELVPGDNLIRQSLELEADTNAALVIFENLLGSADATVNRLQDIEGYDFLDNPRGPRATVFLLAFTAIVLAIKLFRFRAPKVSLWPTKTHPPDEVRRQAVLWAVKPHVTDWQLDDSVAHQLTISSMLGIVDIKLRDTLAMPPLTSRWHRQLLPGGDFEKHGRRLLAIYLENASTVKSYSFIKL